VIDSDRNAHEELESPEVVRTLVSWWGKEVVCPDGQCVSRKAIARIVFSSACEADSSEALKRLEALLYPRLARKRDVLIRRLMAENKVQAIVLDSPKLIEAGLDRECDKIVFVDADRVVRLARLAKQRGWSAQEMALREKSQVSLDSKRKKADYKIVNNSSVDALRPTIERLFSDILESFSTRRETSVH